MLVELVETDTQDGLTLNGALHPPAGPHDAAAPCDAVLLMHGVGSNFYGSPLLAYLAERFAAQGLMALRANTRGHDFVCLARSSAGPQRQGAAFETVGQCHYDIAAWLALLEQRGANRIGILGHSLGAIKAIYSTAYHGHAATAFVIAISPPRLSYAAFQQGSRRTLFSRHMARAQSHVDEGKPETLMRVKYPFPLLITAAGYLEKYGPAEKYNVLRFADRLDCPILFTYGQQELESGSASFAQLPEELQNLSSEAGRLQSLTIEGANHLYDGCYAPLARQIQVWLDGLRTAGK